MRSFVCTCVALFLRGLSVYGDFVSTGRLLENFPICWALIGVDSGKWRMKGNAGLWWLHLLLGFCAGEWTGIGDGQNGSEEMG